MQHSLFVYGTLAQPDMQMELLGRTCPMTVAQLDGYKICHGKWPYLVVASDSVVSGWVIETLSNADIAILDAYEKDLDAPPNADNQIYTREQRQVRVGGETKPAWVYFPILEKWRPSWKAQ